MGPNRKYWREAYPPVSIIPEFLKTGENIKTVRFGVVMFFLLAPVSLFVP